MSVLRRDRCGSCKPKDEAALNEAAGRLKQAGAKMRPAKSFEGITICDGTDPEGNVFQVTTRP